MNPKQKQYFKQKLLDWKEALLKGSTETIINLKEDKEVLRGILLILLQLKVQNLLSFVPEIERESL